MVVNKRRKVRQFRVPWRSHARSSGGGGLRHDGECAVHAVKDIFDVCRGRKEVFEDRFSRFLLAVNRNNKIVPIPTRQSIFNVPEKRY